MILMRKSKLVLVNNNKHYIRILKDLRALATSKLKKEAWPGLMGFLKILNENHGLKMQKPTSTE